ncbi:acylphosphatase-2-like isoform X1 [Sinocyclocheilus rhinocerous]|uniref:Acylphosphatase n=2 Tax=Sinocyclocheilus rhinocerous TaxID=307959 RepID=A0A673H6Y4_9TELE|nr:PREDICTED: acylphosphatase-2-like isoform X1 [Sinocyclocheilus rhinocerous]
MIICHSNVSWTSLLVLTLVILLAMSSDAGEKYVSVDFEVFGNVQGVCFRMYTEAEAKKLGVTGWVKNTRQGTVVGQVQGHPEKVKEMKYWLSQVGSPSSGIHRAQFTNEKPISKLEIHGFGTRY